MSAYFVSRLAKSDEVCRKNLQASSALAAIPDKPPESVTITRNTQLPRLIPLLAAIHEQLPWVRQWHNDIDPAMDVRPGNYFTSWIDQQLNHQGWITETVAGWQPESTTRRQHA
ncbi:DUF7008 domain-containing protein [Spectribacter hydrogenooxidans]|uniref:DUF7008 domain-containing protein n=1 Tax=Spectribacter hydrogenoxidans TaxID=3075608 RepID=A0ABU3BXB4_9GAMM|nr:hypothetical protein [Salinisphaera sp. W335]MDT0633954.1 hypothetical protein [Salinisphaera sp. W335]